MSSFHRLHVELMGKNPPLVCGRPRAIAEPISIDAREAWFLMQAEISAKLIDTRSTMEFVMIGHPQGAVHIPWQDDPDWACNPRFTEDIKSLIANDENKPDGGYSPPIILICRCGERSLEAGKRLMADGLEKVYNVEFGFEGPLDEKRRRSSVSGWRFDGLPWQQF